MNIKPLGNRVLVRPVESQDKKQGLIIIPDIAKEQPTECLVVALGTGLSDEHGIKIPFEVKPGDRVIVSKYGGAELKVDGETFKMMNSEDIMAVVE